MTQRPYALAAIAAVTGAALGALLAVGHAGGPDAGVRPIAQPQPVAPPSAQAQSPSQSQAPSQAQSQSQAQAQALPRPSPQYAAPAEEPGAVRHDESIEPIRDLSLGA